MSVGICFPLVRRCKINGVIVVDTVSLANPGIYFGGQTMEDPQSKVEGEVWIEGAKRLSIEGEARVESAKRSRIEGETEKKRRMGLRRRLGEPLPRKC